MTQKILIIGGTGAVKSDLLLATLREKYGNDILVVTPEEADEQGLKMEDFANIPTMEIKAPPIIPYVQTEFKSGKEKRRDRRKNKNRNGSKRGL
jgi:predicted ATP-dependent serine protease